MLRAYSLYSTFTPHALQILVRSLAIPYYSGHNRVPRVLRSVETGWFKSSRFTYKPTYVHKQQDCEEVDKWYMMLHKTNAQTERSTKVEFEEMVQKRDGAAESGSSGDGLLKNARRVAMVRMPVYMGVRRGWLVEDASYRGGEGYRA